MSDINELRRQLYRWSNKKDEASRKLKVLKRRRDDVHDIKKELDRAADNNSRDINSKLKNARNKLEEGVEWGEKESLFDQILATSKEDKGDGDSNVSSASSCLDRELSDINDKIQSAQNDYDYAKDRVSDLKREILRERLKND